MAPWAGRKGGYSTSTSSGLAAKAHQRFQQGTSGFMHQLPVKDGDGNEGMTAG